MTMNFGDAAAWFTEKSDELIRAKEQMLLAAAKIVEEEAKNELGTYQGDAPPFEAWPPLKPATIAAKGGKDTPLYTTGALRDSIQSVLSDDCVYVGSDSPYAAFHEFGTSRIPPRPFLGRAAFIKQDEIAAVQAEIIDLILTI